MSQATAIVFPAPRQVELQHYEVPELADDEFLVRTEYSGISQGTEIWAYDGKRPELQFPTVPGYQTIGRIEQVGRAVRSFAPGQRVLANRSRLPASFPETWMGAHPTRVITKEATVVPDECDPVGAAISALPAVSLRGLPRS